VRLDPDDVEAIAARVAELLGPPPTATPRYVDAATLAEVLGIERQWVYAHATQLGALRLGSPRGRLRFDLEHVRRVLAAGDCEAVPAASRPRRRRVRCELDRRAEKS
jgi:hypothetical protein